MIKDKQIRYVNKNNIKQDDLFALFAHGKWDEVRTNAENAWLEGLDADANPYNRKYDRNEWHIWNSKWIECNRYC